MEIPDKNKGDVGPGALGEGASARFTRIETNIRELRSEMRAGFENVDARFDKMDEKFDRKFDRLMSGLLSTAVATVIALVGLIGTLIGTHAF